MKLLAGVTIGITLMIIGHITWRGALGYILSRGDVCSCVKE